ncbi:hypothetical protein [Niabella hibiscisoli]|uniref:hypothetical protein n=1 Tax=Niabella hibiscisoli TaxID=1825928 RepID=UPI001F0F877C|nr:hypothetical protein [Niabella hibiscisoli]MCH5718550.1 hypothetical protein [Niabella hibiscisoli]
MIENFSIDKFRPLVKYIKEPDIETAFKNVELLAWLINFEPRPLEHWRKTSRSAKEASAEKELDGNNDAGITLPVEKVQTSVATEPVVERAPVEKDQG